MYGFGMVIWRRMGKRLLLFFMSPSLPFDLGLCACIALIKHEKSLEAT